MLNDATGFQNVYIVCRYTDLRSGINKLASIIEDQTGTSPFVPDTLYLFCGRKTHRIKRLVWEKDGFLLLYERLEQGRFQWPCCAREVQALTPQQFRWLVEGLTIAPSRTVRKVTLNMWHKFLCRTEKFSVCVRTLSAVCFLRAGGSDTV